MRDKISACITAGNEERNIRRCLESVRWADEIVVVDSYSEDGTVEICREYTDRVIQHEWLGYIGQKNLARDLASHPWVLFVDADEVVCDDLRDEILEVLAQGDEATCNGYEFPRVVRFLGRWITHGEWYPDCKLRLFRKEHGRAAGREPHDSVVVDGPVKRLNSPLLHFTYASIHDQVRTLNSFAAISAKSMNEDRRTAGILALVFRPPFRFFKAYIVRRGYLDGFQGFLIAVSSSFGVFIKYAKLWELQRAATGCDVTNERQTSTANPLRNRRE